MLLFLLALACVALAIYALCFTRFVLFASFEKASGDNGVRTTLLWIAAGPATGFVVALPSIFSSVASVLAKRGPFP